MAAVLHLGNVDYTGDSHGMAQFVDTKTANNVAEVERFLPEGVNPSLSPPPPTLTASADPKWEVSGVSDAPFHRGPGGEADVPTDRGTGPVRQRCYG